MSSERAINPETGEERVDCISLETYPACYDIVLGKSHHDVRSIAQYIIAGGEVHPLTRRLFTYEECDAIFYAVPSSTRNLLADWFLDKMRDKINFEIGVSVAHKRFRNLLDAIKHDTEKKEAFFTFATEDTHGAFESPSPGYDYPLRIVDSYSKIRALLKDAWDASFPPACRAEVSEALHSRDIERKLAFINSIAVPGEHRDIIPELQDAQIETMVCLIFKWHDMYRFGC
jgi:hypothetical protein